MQLYIYSMSVCVYVYVCVCVREWSDLPVFVGNLIHYCKTQDTFLKHKHISDMCY